MVIDSQRMWQALERGQMASAAREPCVPFHLPMPTADHSLVAVCERLVWNDANFNYAAIKHIKALPHCWRGITEPGETYRDTLVHGTTRLKPRPFCLAESSFLVVFGHPAAASNLYIDDARCGGEFRTTFRIVHAFVRLVRNSTPQY